MANFEGSSVVFGKAEVEHGEDIEPKKPFRKRDHQRIVKKVRPMRFKLGNQRLQGFKWGGNVNGHISFLGPGLNSRNSRKGTPTLSLNPHVMENFGPFGITSPKADSKRRREYALRLHLIQYFPNFHESKPVDQDGQSFASCSRLQTRYFTGSIEELRSIGLAVFVWHLAPDKGRGIWRFHSQPINPPPAVRFGKG